MHCTWQHAQLREQKSRLDLGAAVVTASHEEDLAEAVHRYTEGKGADLIFDALAGPVLEILAPCAALAPRLANMAG
jgi:NADPH:quinone reductase-like Zn-dependent oxidoreductase